MCCRLPLPHTVDKRDAFLTAPFLAFTAYIENVEKLEHAVRNHI